MESAATPVSAARPAAARHRQPLARPGRGGVHGELSLARINRRNVLLVGPDHLVGKLVDFLVAEPPPYAPLRRIDAWRAVQPASRASDTVVVRHVDRLTLPEQRRMLEWLASKDRRTQVVSTASAPLLPLVESGAFNDSLYYRLNMVYVDLSD